MTTRPTGGSQVV